MPHLHCTALGPIPGGVGQASFYAVRVSPSSTRNATRRHFQSPLSFERIIVMEDTFRSSWRMVALPLLLTAVVVGSALGFAFY